MSTNFYWMHDAPRELTLVVGGQVEYDLDNMDPRIHIGKRSSEFIWAQDPVKVRLLCEKFKDTKIIYDEYYVEYTGKEFLDRIDTYRHNTDLIGYRFC